KAGVPVLESVTTAFSRGYSAPQELEVQTPTPRHRSEPRGKCIGAETVRVDRDQPRRYAAASGDNNPIHLDDVAARAAGLPGVIAHGMCTLAMCLGAATRLTAHPGSVRFFAASLSHPVRPGEQLHVSVYHPTGAAEDSAYTFDACLHG